MRMNRKASGEKIHKIEYDLSKKRTGRKLFWKLFARITGKPELIFILLSYIHLKMNGAKKVFWLIINYVSLWKPTVGQEMERKKVLLLMFFPLFFGSLPFSFAITSPLKIRTLSAADWESGFSKKSRSEIPKENINFHQVIILLWGKIYIFPTLSSNRFYCPIKDEDWRR